MKLSGSLWSALRENGGFSYAERPLRKAIQVAIEYLGESLSILEFAHYNLAFCLHLMGSLDDAEALYRKAFDFHDRQKVQSDPALALRLNTFGNLLRSKNNFVGAEALYRRAWLILEENPQFPLHNGAGILISLAESLLALHRPLEAQRYIEQLLKIIEDSSTSPWMRNFVLERSVAFFAEVGDNLRAEKLQMEIIMP